MIADIAVNWAVAHQDYLYGLATGYALAHIPEAVCYAFHLAMRVPWLRSAVVRNPEQAKKIIRQIEAELEKDIDAEAASEKPADAPKA